MNATVSADGSLGGKGGIKVLLTEIESIFPGSPLYQLVGNHADDLAASFQAAFLRSPIRPTGIPGNQCQPLQCSLTPNFFRKQVVFLPQLPASHQRHCGGIEEPQITTAPQAAGRLPSQAESKQPRIVGTDSGNRNAALPLSPGQIPVQLRLLPQQIQNTPAQLLAAAHLPQVEFRQLPFPIPMGKGGNPCRQIPKLRVAQYPPLRISQMAGQQQKPTLPGDQRNLLLGGAGVLTSSTERLPSASITMG